MTFLIRLPHSEPGSVGRRLRFMQLNLVWLVLGLATAATINSLALTSDYLGVVLPQVSVDLAVLILLVGTRTAGPEFLRTMVFPIGLGLFYLLEQSLQGMAAMPLIFGIWFGLANRLLARPVSLPALLGQSAVILATGLLFWRHLGVYPIGTLAGLVGYAALSTRRTGPRVVA